jgi:hypothetical protein
MRVSRDGVTCGLRALWISVWALWLAGAALQPLPPWRASEVLVREEAVARHLAEDPALVPYWSLDLGGLVQQQALGPGWGSVEGAAGARYRRTRLLSPELRFWTPAWPDAWITLQAGAQAIGQVPVAVILDGEPRGSIELNGARSKASLALGSLAAGRHRVALQSPLGTPIAGVAVGSAALTEPSHDAGFVQWIAIGAHERPAFFPSARDAVPPPGTEIVARGGRRGWYAFGVGPPVDGLGGLLEVLHGLVGAAIVTLVTGLGYAAWCVPSGAARLAVAPLFSLGAVALVFGMLRILGSHLTAVPMAFGLFALGALPLLRRPPHDTLAVPWRALVPAGLALGTLVVFALRVVPPLDDQDLEVQATAFALARHGEPLTVTDRGTTYFFAHPPLLHVCASAAFVLAGRLDRVADAPALARRARERGPFAEPALSDYPPPHYDLWQMLLERFFTKPHLWPTRQVNVLLAALAVGWLAELGAAMSGRSAVGVAVALVLASFPEFLVRGAYGGYFAITTFGLLATLSVLEQNARGWPAAAAAALGALGDQKGLLVPVAWLLAAPRRAGRGRFLPGLGALLGLLAFAAWGLAIDARTFMYDFVKVHVLRRLSLADLRWAPGHGGWYPSISELWLEFAAHYGLLFTIAALAASLLALRSQSARVRVCGVSVLLGAVVFSLTDWRQTKHLSLLAAPALLALAAACPAAPRGRMAFLALLGLMIAVNLAKAWPLFADFSVLLPSTIW